MDSNVFQGFSIRAIKSLKLLKSYIESLLCHVVFAPPFRSSVCRVWCHGGALRIHLSAPVQRSLHWHTEDISGDNLLPDCRLPSGHRAVFRVSLDQSPWQGWLFNYILRDAVTSTSSIGEDSRNRRRPRTKSRWPRMGRPPLWKLHIYNLKNLNKI